MGGLPLGLAHQVKLVRPVKKGQSLSWADVAMDTGTHAYQVRREMEKLFSADLDQKNNERKVLMDVV